MTALNLAANGIRFEWQGCKLVCFGPSERPDLYEQLRQEVARRVAVMLPKLDGSRDYRSPELNLLEAPPHMLGLCSSCGESLGATYRSGDCSLCVAARYKALVAAGRLAT
jgi:hypothetical protein